MEQYEPIYHNENIPLSTPTRLIFPYDKKTKRFWTSNYALFQTYDRIGIHELENFLEQASTPIRKWQIDHSFLLDSPILTAFLLILCTLLIPLLPLYCCLISSAQAKAIKKLNAAAEVSKTFVQINSLRWTARGLKWDFPSYFPQWIELQMDYCEPPREGRLNPVVKGIPVKPRPKIHTICLPQQEYQIIDIPNHENHYCSPMSQDQFDANMYYGSTHQSIEMSRQA